jgi:hypothetical protein
MRLKPEKVDYLSKKITEALRQLNKLHFVAKPEDIQGSIRRVIMADLQREDEIEREAEAIIKQHRLTIDRHNMSYNTLVSRAKQEIARKRKVIL